MKKAILFSLMACLLLFSCKKEHSAAIKPVQKTYQVNFTVSGSGQQLTGSTGKQQVNSLKTDAQISIAGYMDILYYYVLNSSGTVVHILQQDSTQTNFGTISDNLPAGSYTIIMVAGKKGLVYNNATPTGENTAFLIYYDLVNGVTPWEDTFYTKFSLTVTNSNINQSVTLSRVVGELETKILDTIPTTANSLVISVNNEDFEIIVPDWKPYNAKVFTDSIVLAPAAKGKANFTVDNIIGNTFAPFTVTIKCYDNTNKLIGNVVVNGVTCQQNTRTILSGKLFGSGTGINVGLGGWKTPININF
jgi:hypothetical protein